MTIARRPSVSAEDTPATSRATPEMRPAAPVRIPVPLRDAPVPDAATPAGRLRRCTYRRLDRTVSSAGRPAGTTYDVMCLYVDRDTPLALGDIESAQPICEACLAPGIFRPDED